MKLASKTLIGKHNFLAFSNRKEKNPIKELFNIEIEKENDQIVISIIGDSFYIKWLEIS